MFRLWEIFESEESFAGARILINWIQWSVSLISKSLIDIHFPWIHKFQIDISLQFPFCQSFSQLSPVNGVIFHVFRQQHFEMKCFGSNFLLFIINFKFKFELYFCRCWFGIWRNFAASRVCSVRGQKFTCVFQCQTSTSSSSIFLLLIFQTSSISQPFSWQRIALWLWAMIW